jgi:chromosome segregation ATPase
MERRKVFEEAAGISRFRAKKRETELKLAKVAKDNLGASRRRIIAVIQKNVRSLKHRSAGVRERGRKSTSASSNSSAHSIFTATTSR